MVLQPRAKDAKPRRSGPFDKAGLTQGPVTTVMRRRRFRRAAGNLPVFNVLRRRRHVYDILTTTPGPDQLPLSKS